VWVHGAGTAPCATQRLHTAAISPDDDDTTRRASRHTNNTSSERMAQNTYDSTVTDDDTLDGLHCWFALL